MFECNQCGLCCRNIDKIPQLKDFHDGNGICKYLHNNICSIYDNRPDICSVDRMYEKYFENQYTRSEFYDLNKLVCEEIKNLNI